MKTKILLLMLVTGLCFLPTERVTAQRRGGTPGPGNIPDEMLLQQLMSVTHNPRLRDDLEIVDEQIKDLELVLRDYQKVQQKMMLKNQEAMQAAQQAAREGQVEMAREMMREFQKEMRELSADPLKRINEILLPHQIQRVRQIALQMVLKITSGYGDEFGMPLALADHLGLSRTEKEALKKKIDDARQEYADQLEALKKSTRNKILQAIPAEKRKEYHSIIGDLFDLEQSIRDANQSRMTEERRKQER